MRYWKKKAIIKQTGGSAPITRKAGRGMESFKYSYKTEESDNILVNVNNSGYQKCEGGYTMGPIIRNRYIIHHVVSGRGYYTVNQNTYTIEEGDSFIIYPNTVVSYSADQEDPWEYYWVGFGGADVKGLISQTDFSKHHPVISTDRSQELKDILLNIYRCSGANLYNRIAMVGYLYLFLSVLIQCSQKHEHDVDSSVEYIKKAVDFISENYEHHLTITDIANHLGVSRSHLYRVFMRHISQSPKAYLENYRIRQGSMLLRQTSMTVNEVASSVGYDDQLHFSKVFKKLTGLSPKEYRRQERENQDGQESL